MFKLYDTAFKIGFAFNILIFVVLNSVSFITANYEYANRKIDFSPCCIGPIWGFPFDMTRYETFSLNVLIIAACGFVSGVVFKALWLKIRSQKFEVTPERRHLVGKVFEKC
jgi:hypothetical protein